MLFENGRGARGVTVVLCALVAWIFFATGVVAASSLPAVALRSGHIGRYEWWSALEAPESDRERESGNVCLAISMLEPLPAHRAEGSAVAGCGKPSESQPLVEHLRGGRGKHVRTVLAALFPAGVRRVYLKVAGRPGHNYPAGLLDQGAVQGISSSPLAFFAHGFSNSACIQRMVGYDAEGAVLSHLGRQSCR